jgi:hypothetical protein
MPSKFELDLSRFAKKVGGDGGRMDTVIRKIGLELFSRLVLRSPVGNPDRWKHPVKGYVGGRFRANWQVSIGLPAAHALDLTDRSGSATITKGAAVIANVRADRMLFFVNALPYGRRLEYGWSGQAPAGMVRVTIAEFNAIAAGAAKE